MPLTQCNIGPAASLNDANLTESCRAPGLGGLQGAVVQELVGVFFQIEKLIGTANTLLADIHVNVSQTAQKLSTLASRVSSVSNSVTETEAKYEKAQPISLLKIGYVPFSTEIQPRFMAVILPQTIPSVMKKSLSETKDAPDFSKIDAFFPERAKSVIKFSDSNFFKKVLFQQVKEEKKKQKAEAKRRRKEARDAKKALRAQRGKKKRAKIVKRKNYRVNEYGEVVIEIIEDKAEPAAETPDTASAPPPPGDLPPPSEMPPPPGDLPPPSEMPPPPGDLPPPGDMLPPPSVPPPSFAPPPPGIPSAIPAPSFAPPAPGIPSAIPAPNFAPPPPGIPPPNFAPPPPGIPAPSFGAPRAPGIPPPPKAAPAANDLLSSIRGFGSSGLKKGAPRAPPVKKMSGRDTMLSAIRQNPRHGLKSVKNRQLAAPKPKAKAFDMASALQSMMADVRPSSGDDDDEESDSGSSSGDDSWDDDDDDY